jgi:uncharacterized protein YbaP (TraB family)
MHRLRTALRQIRHLAAFLFATLLFAAPATAKVALWQIDDGDTKIWLLGTIHALPAKVDWHSPAIDNAIGSASELVLETVIDHDPQKTTGLILALGTAPGLPPIAERVALGKRPALARMIAETKVPTAAFDRLKTWAAAFLLVGLTVRDAIGDSNMSGVETALAERFTASKRPISGLETAAQQLGFFNTLSEEEQRRFLEDTVDSGKKAKSDYKTMLRAWLKGDDEAIAHSFDTEEEISPVLRDVLIRKRNIAWADWLAKRLEQPGQLLVAVGAGHLAGADSVQKQLAARGIKVTRVE